jgi:hypothetical protein
MGNFMAQPSNNIATNPILSGYEFKIIGEKNDKNIHKIQITTHDKRTYVIKYCTSEEKNELQAKLNETNDIGNKMIALIQTYKQVEPNMANRKFTITANAQGEVFVSGEVKQELVTKAKEARDSTVVEAKIDMMEIENFYKKFCLDLKTIKQMVNDVKRCSENIEKDKASKPSKIHTANAEGQITLKEDSTAAASRDQGPELSRKAARLPPVFQMHNICAHEGNSCFIHSALQIAAHFSYYSDLFNLSSHPLAKQADETEDHFKNRQQVQFLGYRLLQEILSKDKKKVEGAREFLKAIEACRVLEKSAEQFLRDGGDVGVLLNNILDILDPAKEFKRPPTVTCGINEPLKAMNPGHAEHLKEHQEAIEKKRQENRTQACEGPFFRMTKADGDERKPPLSMTMNGMDFTLEAIVRGGTGHATALIRSGEDYIEYDDLQSQPVYHKKDEMSQWFGNCPWVCAYYSKKEVQR